ncbi:hypothetical protein A6E15_00275 [Natrinema saccharevitans]|uniref:GH26 domain-containing protein n=1 Tax=Natrinema saccharevitans TaxID=301967 RepID=A0A1S8AS90_9EURY|nr:hypothetical protein A6E15_00275 [Natrinema saccharevitans]
MTRTGSFLHGVTPSRVTRERLTLFEEWADSSPAVVNVFANLGWSDAKIEDLFEIRLTRIWEHGHVPMLILQPFFGIANHPDTEEDFDEGDQSESTDNRDEATSPLVARDIADGEYDDVLSRWTAALDDWLHPGDGSAERRLYLNFAPEMNGDWVPWSGATGDSTPADFVDMWERTYEEVTDGDISDHHLQWIWAPDNVGTPSAGYSISEYYPGDNYVDWIGMHGYNWYEWGGWVSPRDLYDHVIDRLQSVTDKPIAFSEYGTSSQVADEHRPERKGEWIDTVLEYLADSDVQLACWFNVDKETDWAVLDGGRGTGTWEHEGETYNTYPEYRTGIRKHRALPAHPDHPRRLTDEEFRGVFDSEAGTADTTASDAGRPSDS